MSLSLPDPSLVLLVGIAGCGKSTFARRHFAPTEIVSSDELRAMVADDPTDQRASGDAFKLLKIVLDMRCKRRLTTVVDATNLERRARKPYLRTAEERGVAPVAIVLDVPLELCLSRDAERSERYVGEAVLRRQYADLERTREQLPDEGYAAIHVLSSAEEMDAVEIEREATSPGAEDPGGRVTRGDGAPGGG